MKNRAHGCFEFAVLVGVFAIAMSAHADTLLWYRFDGDGATIENKAAPGTMDGTLKSIVWGQGVGNQGNDSTKFPKRGDAFPEGTGVIDPVSGESYPGQIRSLSFTGDQSTAGMVLLKKANAAPLLSLTSFTCEVFFRIPAAAANRTPALFPILTFGEEDATSKQGWKFGFYRDSGTKLSPWFRGSKKTSTGARDSEVVTINAANGNNDNYTYDTWHHLALVVDGAGDGSAATVKLILDYTVVQTQQITSYYGFYFNPNGGFPLTIGADIYRNRSDESKRETFMGDIAEFRISDTALSGDQLLRPLPAGPVDADTLVYLPMGDSGWFGSPNASNYKNIYHGVLNAALTAAYTPSWLFNASSNVPYPAVAADAIDGNVRNGYLSTTDYADAKSMQFSRALVSSKYQGHVVVIPYENANLASGSFTLEWFFKTDGEVEYGNDINSYTFMYNSFAKIMINQKNGKLLTRLTPDSGSTKDFNSTARVDDGEWHHYAFVYDKKQGAFAAFLDYSKIASETFTLTTSTQTPFSFGGMGRQEQSFSGWLDDFRITRRALKADEFLTTRELVSQDALFAHFEDDYSTGQDLALAPAGEGGTLGGGSAPTFVDTNRRIDLDGDGKADYTSTKALSLDGGSVVWPHNSLLEKRDFTVEWFAKYNSLANTTMLMRLGMESGTGGGTMCWALYTIESADKLRMGAQTTADGAWTSNINRDDKNFEFKQGESVVDGKWHHWALVAQTDPDVSPANTTFKLYRDYVQVGSALAYDGKDHAGGILALPSTGTTLSIGTGGKAINGMIDELRITPSVLAPKNFMRRLPSGLTLILR
jgi:hypothetical protein